MKRTLEFEALVLSVIFNVVVSFGARSPITKVELPELGEGELFINTVLEGYTLETVRLMAVSSPVLLIKTE